MGTTQSSTKDDATTTTTENTRSSKASLFDATYAAEEMYDDDDDTDSEQRISFTLEEDSVLDDTTDPTFPWLPILECVAGTLGCGVVRTYNLAEAKTIMLSASRYPLVVPDLIVAEEGRREERETDEKEEAKEATVLRWSSMEGPWSRGRGTRITPRLPSMLQFAGALLRSDVNLTKLRFTSVPSSMSEKMFWCLYLDRIAVLLRRRLAGPYESPNGRVERVRENKRNVVVQIKYGLNSRWERLVSIRDPIARTVGYAICSIPLFTMRGGSRSGGGSGSESSSSSSSSSGSLLREKKESGLSGGTGGGKGGGQRRRRCLASEWWTCDMRMDEMLE